MRKKRLFAALLILALLLAALPMAASGASDLAFVAVNETIPVTLSGGELPFYSGGMLYIPYTVFNAVSLNFYPSYQPGDKTLTLFSRSSRLVFDLTTGSVTDEEKVIQQIPAIASGGTVFVPAAFCASHFGVQTSVLTSQSGYTVVRFRTGSEIYDDGLFIEKAESLISYRVSQYQESTAPSTPTTPTTPSTDPTPSTPATPADPGEEDPQEQPPARVCLAILDAVSMDGALDTLAAHKTQATFFLTAEEILTDPDLVRRIAAQGHTIGLRVPEDEDPAAALAWGNEALDQVLKSKTLLALVPEGLDTAAVDPYYCVISQPAERLSATAAAQAHGETHLLLCSAEQLAVSLDILREAQAELVPLLETTVFS